MYNLSLFFLGLLSLSFVTLGNIIPNPDVDATPPVRFCYLPSNATCYCCDWNGYAENLFYRSMGVIIGCGVTFIVLLIALCCCCWDTSLKDNLIAGEEGPGAWCPSAIKALLMVIPLVLILAGCLFVLIAHYNVDPVFVSSAKELQLSLTQLQDNKNTLLNMLAQKPGSIDVTQINGGISDLTGNVNDFTVEEYDVNIGRNVIVWFACGFSALTAILGCLYVQFNRGCLFEFYCACAIFLIFGSCCTIAVLDVIHNVTIDLCTELYYPKGLVQLWQVGLTQAVEKTEIDQVNPQIQAAVDDACSNFADMCQMTCCRTTCGICNTTNVDSFLNRTINDNGKQRKVSDCPQHCTNSTLQMITNTTITSIDTKNFWNQINTLMDNLMLPFGEPSLIIMLKGFTCGLDPSIGEIWAGCGLFIGGAIVGTILCMLLRGKERREEKD